MSHYPLGVFVPNRIVSLGDTPVVRFVDKLIKPFHWECERAPYRRYFTPEETELLAKEHGVSADNLPELAAAIATGESMVKYGWVDAEEQGIVGWVSSVGVTSRRIYCITTQNPEPMYDWYFIGRKFHGMIADPGDLVEPDIRERHSMDDETKLVGNMAPVEKVIEMIHETHYPFFVSFLTPEGKWYEYFGPTRSGSWSSPSWNLWHLRRFRLGHHVVMVDYHE